MAALEHARQSAQEFPIISQKEARALGLTKCFTGKPCLRGHVAERWVGGGCIECGKIIRAKNAERTPALRAAWYQRNAESERARKAKRYAENPEKIREIKRRSAEKHRDKIKSYSREYYRKNHERLAQYGKSWRANNPEKRRILDRNRAAREQNAEGKFSVDDIKNLMSLQRSKCANCKGCLRHSYHIDHIIPLARGGTNWPKNLQLLCPPCNLRKNSKDPIDWAFENGRLV